MGHSTNSRRGIVTEFYKNGNILQYIRSNPLVNKLNLVRLKCLFPRKDWSVSLKLAQASAGIVYLHSLGIVHDAIRAGRVYNPWIIMTFVDNLGLKANIMIDDEGVPLIKDQGFRYSIGRSTLDSQRFIVMTKRHILQWATFTPWEWLFSRWWRGTVHTSNFHNTLWRCPFGLVGRS